MEQYKKGASFMWFLHENSTKLEVIYYSFCFVSKPFVGQDNYLLYNTHYLVTSWSFFFLCHYVCVFISWEIPSVASFLCPLYNRHVDNFICKVVFGKIVILRPTNHFRIFWGAVRRLPRSVFDSSLKNPFKLKLQQNVWNKNKREGGSRFWNHININTCSNNVSFNNVGSRFAE